MSAAGLVIIGAGGFGRETARAALDGGYDGTLLGFLDDDPGLAGATVAGMPVLGPVAALAELPDAQVIVATGRPDNYTSRPRIVAGLGIDEARWATVVHPGASLASDTTVGPGSVLLAGVIATAGVRIGSHAAVMPLVVLTHDVHVGDFATIASAVALAGGVRVGDGAYLGAGTMVREGCSVGGWAMTGMASLVLADVPPGRLWFGSPATDRDASPAAGFTLAALSGGTPG
ncbi:MAG: NeuD/PglB/VioB family sugar acetyltransferase [Candidatus Nanopelagicales bacterium]